MCAFLVKTKKIFTAGQQVTDYVRLETKLNAKIVNAMNKHQETADCFVLQICASYENTYWSAALPSEMAF